MRQVDKNKRPKSAGFSLIEVAIVLVIVGLIFSSIISGLKPYKNAKSVIVTKDHMELTQEVLREFYGLEGRYPCPADPTLSKNDPNFGLEFCRANPLAACPAGIVCSNIGSRDADGDGVADPVTIGAIPARTLAENALYAEFKIVNGQNGFLTKITYAVSELMTDVGYTVSNPANAQLGAVALRDEFGRSIIDPEDSAHYVFLSHGENSRGAFTLEGQDLGDCTVTVLGVPGPLPAGDNIGAAGIEVEKENCDRNDAIFVKGLKSMGMNDNYFDDIVYFNTTAANNLWKHSNFSPPGLSYLYNTNIGDVGVGTNDPVNKLHVNGDVRIETSIEADGGYCGLNEADCLLPEALAGTAMTPCPAGQTATGIENNDLVCAPLFGGPISFTCPNPGEFVTGFSNLGNVACSTTP